MGRKGNGNDGDEENTNDEEKGCVNKTKLPILMHYAYQMTNVSALGHSVGE